MSYGEALLAPTVLYSPVTEALYKAGIVPHYSANITAIVTVADDGPINGIMVRGMAASLNRVTVDGGMIAGGGRGVARG